MDSTVTNQYKELFGDLSLNSDSEKESLFCNGNFLVNTRKKVMDAYNRAVNNTRIHNFTDNYSPYLLKLREKYAEKKIRINLINKNFNENSENFELAKKSYISQAQQTIAAFDVAIEKLNYIAKFKLLELTSDLEAEFANFKKDSYPSLTGEAAKSLMQTFSNFSIFCSADYFDINCTNDSKNLEEKVIKEEYSGFLNKIALKDASEAKFLDEEGLILLVKQAKKNLEYTRDIVQKKKYTGLFHELATEFEDEAEFTFKYLTDLKPFQPSDFVESKAVNETVIADKNMPEPDLSVHKFEKHFLNLLDSAAYICWVFKHNTFSGM